MLASGTHIQDIPMLEEVQEEEHTVVVGADEKVGDWD